jgi:peptidoglycan/LPS O-acetylase OafA/YrhL
VYLIVKIINKTQDWPDGFTKIFLQQLLLMQSVIPDSPNYFNYPSWSISAEFVAYLAFGFICFLFPSKKDLIFVMLAIMGATLISFENIYGLGGLVECIAGFFAGCLVGKLCDLKFRIKNKWISLLFFFALDEDDSLLDRLP